MVDRKDKEIIFWKKMENNIDKNIKIDIKEYINYAGINTNLSLNVLNNFLKGKDIKISDKVKEMLIREKAKYKPKKIKILSELLLQGETPENIEKMEELKLTNVKLSSNESSYKLYYLLMNMPSGLPDCFLQLIFPDYDNINDNNNLIMKSIDNWNIINKEKIIEQNFKDINKMKLCYINLFETLKIYAQLLKYYIDENREKILYKNGEIHYIFNSYSNENIWKSNIPYKFRNIISKNNLNQDYNIKMHLENILNLIDFIIININSFLTINEIKEEFDKYLNEILLLFSSYFFLKNDNIKYIQKCIEFCNKLLRIRRKKFELLMQKLLLYLYSVDENKKEILQLENNKIIDDNLKIEIFFLKEIRKNNKNIEGLEKLLKENISDDMKFNIYREIAIYNFKIKNYVESVKYLEYALNIENINNLFRQRTIIDFCFNLKKFFEFYEGNIINSFKKNYLIKDKLIEEKINQLNEIIENPLEKNLYYESYRIKEDIYNLYKPDIVMLNSNPLKKISNYSNQLNNQFFILKELQKSLNYNIRIKSYVLNEKNLKNALSKSGKILIIQSDEFNDNGDIICESKDGESYVFKKQDLYQLLKSYHLSYYIVVLCFPKSAKLKEYFDSNKNNFQDYYWITFEDFDNSIIDNQSMKEINKLSIQFLIDFIKFSAVNNNEKISYIFELAKTKFFDNLKLKSLKILCKNYIILSMSSISYLNIEYQIRYNERGIFLYGDFPKLDEFDKDLDDKDLSFKIFDLIKYIKNENKLIFYCDETTKKVHLKISFEIMKFFYRHKTFNELYYIDIRKDGKTLLKSLVRKLKNIKNIDNEESEDDDIEDKIETKKACFILINNCTSHDLIDVNIYSILDSNSSFIIIYDKENGINKKKQNKIYYENIIELNISEKVTSQKKESNENAIKEITIRNKLKKFYESIVDNECKQDKETYFYSTCDFSEKIQSSLIDKEDESNNIGSRLTDFNIEKILRESNSECIYLATSKLNKKLYSIKAIKRGMLNKDQILQIEKIIEILKYNNHPHIIKYYTSFIENDNFYVVMEYIEGESLEYLYKQAKSTNKLIPEKMIWEFLIQTLSGLVCLHENNKIIHGNIRPNNLLLDKENKLKIGDFDMSCYYNKTDEENLNVKCTLTDSISFFKAQIINEEEQYGCKSNIYMLGLTFYFLLTGILSAKKIGIDGDLKIKNFLAPIPENYSEEIKDFISNLLLTDDNKRPSAKTAFSKVISYYTIKYLKITSIISTFECFLALPSIRKYFSSEKIRVKIEKDLERKYIFTKITKKIIYFSNPNNYNYEKLKIQCLKLRMAFYAKNREIEKSPEINCMNIIEKICNKLHKELNEAKINEFINLSGNNKNKDYTNDGMKGIDEADEQQIIALAVKRFEENFKSKISEQIFYLSKYTYKCIQCQNNIKYTTSLHCASCLYPERCALWIKKKILNINDLLSHITKTRLLTNIKLKCKFCNKVYNSFNVTKTFYTSPYNLILGFNYSDESKFILNIDENINISKFVERTDVCKTQLRLVGAIFIEKNNDDTNKYVSYSKDINGQWKYCNGETVQNSSLYELQNHKGIQALFYTTI